MKRWMKIAIAAVIAVPILWFGGVLLYTKVINKADKAAADEFSELADDAAAATTAATDTTVAVETTVAADPAATTAAPAGTAAPTSPIEGSWVVDPSADIYVGYRVEEVLSGVNTTATGRSSAVTGSAAIAGTTLESAEFSVEVATITSDQSRRDDQFRGRIMETETFPTATFVLTAPVALEAVPADGEVVAVPATGDLTLHGVTRSVTFDLQFFVSGGRITATGAIPILFSDYEIQDPSLGPVSTEDNGLLEFLLVMAPA